MWILVMVLFLLIAGCRVTDPITGGTLYSADPNAIGDIETAAQLATGILALFAGVWPWAGPAAGILGGIFGTWSKVKPKLTKAQSEAEMYHSTATSIVTAIEDFKVNNPIEWNKLKAELEHTIGLNAQNIIRAIQGKPAKT